MFIKAIRVDVNHKTASIPNPIPGIIPPVAKKEMMNPAIELMNTARTCKRPRYRWN